jgi:hypothetical protein
MGSLLSSLLWREPDYDEECESSEEEEEEEEHEEDDQGEEQVASLDPLRRYPATLPLDVQNEAAEMVTHMQRTTLTLDPSCSIILEVVLPGRGRRPKSALRWPLVADASQLAQGIRTLMEEDEIKAIRSAPELCARYPGYFWNLVFYFAKDAERIYEFIRTELEMK